MNNNVSAIQKYMQFGDISYSVVDNMPIFSYEVLIGTCYTTGCCEDEVIVHMDIKLLCGIEFLIDRRTHLGFNKERLSKPVSSFRDGFLVLSRDYQLHF